ncbi:MAG: DUF4296 domain-containing protein [Ginsengibacter sp.]
MRIIRIILLIFICSCTNRSSIPDDVIKKPKMEDIMWDMIRADLLAHEIVKRDSTKNLSTETNQLTSKIFAIHHIDNLMFEKSMKFYTSRPDIMSTIFDSLDARRVRKSFFEKEKMKAARRNATR